MITVGLPNFCSPIAWLSMESLCRQITSVDWELIIYEDSDNPLGVLFFGDYADRLRAAGCKKINYKYSQERVPLNQKWIWMGENAHPDSLGLILQASDCYSEPFRIGTAHTALKNGYDWVQTNIGYFYNIATRKMMLYNDAQFTSLNMAISMKQLKLMPKDQEKWSGVDYWLWSYMVEPKIFIDESSNWKKGVDTDGYSRLSVNRKDNYRNPKPPFFKTLVLIKDVLPIDIIERLK